MTLAFLLIVTAPSCFFKSGETERLTEVRTLVGADGKIGEPFGIAAAGDKIYISDGESGKIFVAGPDGSEMRLLTDQLDTPSHIAIDADGGVLVADSGSHTIKRVGDDGSVALVAGQTGTPGFRDGKAAEALFRAPIGIAVRDGKIFVADSYNDRIRVIENGDVSTLAGGAAGYADSDVGSEAEFNTPCGLELLPGGELLVADLQNRRIRLVMPDGGTTTYAGTGRAMLEDGELNSASFVAPTDVLTTDRGEIFVADGDSIRAIGTRYLPIVETISSRRRGFSDGKSGLARFNRVSGLAVSEDGGLLAADSGNGLVRIYSDSAGTPVPSGEIEKNRSEIFAASIKAAKWPYDPPERPREIAGTFGEIRGEKDRTDSEVYFHNGLDIVGGYGETARFVLDEKVLDPEAVRNVGTLRELLRMPGIGYIHINIGRNSGGTRFNDPRFIFVAEGNGSLSVRVPRGTNFDAGDSVGTLNRMNHVHLVAGPEGREVNGLGVLKLPGVSDKRPPVIESVELTDASGLPFETDPNSGRIIVEGKARIVVDAYDQMDGNADRRRLGVYQLGFDVTDESDRSRREALHTPGLGAPTIVFDRLPEYWLADRFYAVGSRSGATGPTVFRYIVSNRLSEGIYREAFLDTSKLEPGNYIVNVFAGDFFGNRVISGVRIRVMPELNDPALARK